MKMLTLGKQTLRPRLKELPSVVDWMAHGCLAGAYGEMDCTSRLRADLVRWGEYAALLPQICGNNSREVPTNHAPIIGSSAFDLGSKSDALKMHSYMQVHESRRRLFS
jgi:hypothetical protein